MSKAACNSDTIYHYCSVRAFREIISTNELWLSDAYYMNDYAEHRWLLDKAVGQITELAKNRRRQGACKALLDNEWMTWTHPYIGCFSMARDSLSQWRAYSDNGAGLAIGFSIDAITKRCKEYRTKDKLDIDLLPVVYDARKQDRVIRGIIREYLAQYAKRMSEGAVGRPDSFDVCATTVRSLWKAAALSKNPGFSEEQEYRIVLRPRIERDRTTESFAIRTVGTTELAIRDNGKRLIPYYKFRFGCDAVVEILVGPKFPDRETTPEYSIRNEHQGIQALLDHCKYHIKREQICDSAVTYH